MDVCNLIYLNKKTVCEVLNFGDNQNINNRLFSLGIICGKKIKILEKTNDYFILAIGKQQLALSKDILNGVEVKICH